MSALWFQLKRNVVLIVSFFCFLGATYSQATEYSVVFVHIGKRIPVHLEESIQQVQKFNPETPVFLLCNQMALESASPSLLATGVIPHFLESLPCSAEHQRFKKESKLDTTSMEGFWRYTSERFFYLHEFALQTGLKHLFHLESDVMLYRNLEEILPVFQEYYPGLGAPFDHDERCIPSFVYVRNEQALRPLIKLFVEGAKKRQNDMQSLSEVRRRTGEPKCVALPVVPLEYVQQEAMTNLLGSSTKERFLYCRHVDLFASLFDAAAFGQFLGGINNLGGPDKRVGFVNETAVYSPLHFSFFWKKDEAGRNIPYASYHGQVYRINNLHIHSKELEKFRS